LLELNLNLTAQRYGSVAGCGAGLVGHRSARARLDLGARTATARDDAPPPFDQMTLEMR
jgi:hypothetical protein